MNEDNNDSCLSFESNRKYCFFKAANAFLLLANVLLIIIGFHYMPTYTGAGGNGSYFSVIVTVLGILITVLVTWQIWQVIDTKNIIKQMQKQVCVEQHKREADYKKYSEQLSLFTYAANCANDAIMMMSEMHNIVHNGLSSARSKIGYNEAYVNLFRALRDAIKANTPETERLVDICLDNMRSCLNNAGVLKNNYENYAMFDRDLSAECEAIFNYIEKYPQGLNRRQFSALKELRNHRIALSKNSPR